MTVLVDTVTGPVGSDRLGLTLTHEHLANRLDARPDAADPGLFELPVEPALRERLLSRPYANRDNVVLDDDAAMVDDLRAFAAVGGGTVVETTPVGLGRSPSRVKRMAIASGVQVVLGGGWYLDRFHPRGVAGRDVDALADAILAQYRPATADEGIVPGIIGEVGVSAAFTPGEERALRAAAVAQRELGKPLMIHLPGWQRLAHRVLDIVLGEHRVAPDAVVLAHMDPSGDDPDYQRAVADRGVWCEFDMVGMPFDFPGEGRSPGEEQTATAISRLAAAGHAGRILLSHDLFLKAMSTRNGGHGLTRVPTVFAAVLRDRGVDATALLTDNPRRLFESAAG